MPFKPGQSGNPGGRPRAIGLSRAVRESEGLKTWAKLIEIRDGKVLEPYFNRETEKTEWLAPGAKTRVEACKLLLAYCWGTPVESDPDGKQAELEQRIRDLEQRLLELLEGKKAS